MLTILRKKLRPSNQNHKSGPPLGVLDLLALSREEQDLKKTCQQTIRQFYEWKCRFRLKEKNSFYYLEGMLLKARARDFVILYRMVRQARMKAFENYISGLPVYGNHARKSS